MNDTSRSPPKCTNPWESPFPCAGWDCGVSAAALRSLRQLLQVWQSVTPLWRTSIPVGAAEQREAAMGCNGCTAAATRTAGRTNRGQISSNGRSRATLRSLRQLLQVWRLGTPLWRTSIPVGTAEQREAAMGCNGCTAAATRTASRTNGGSDQQQWTLNSCVSQPSAAPTGLELATALWRTSIPVGAAEQREAAMGCNGCTAAATRTADRTNRGQISSNGRSRAALRSLRQLLQVWGWPRLRGEQASL